MDDPNEEREPLRLIDTTPMTKEDQISLAEQLQAMVLRTFSTRLEHNTISDTGLATLVRMLAANGWSIDPRSVPKNLADKLTTKVDPAELDADLDNVYPIHRRHA
jgi:hypothetical protein